jgi:predicted ArsR family transcriptional regulator
MTQTKTVTQTRTGTPPGAAKGAHGSDQACATRIPHEKGENGGKATPPKPDTGLSDATIIDYLRHHQTVSVADLVDFTGVTATAVRQRLGRLMDQGLVARKTQHLQAAEQRAAGQSKRGRPTHRYSLTHAGSRSSGSNYEDLANVLWMEIRDIQDPEVRRGLLRRIVARLIEHYRDQVQGDTLRERMNSLAALMDARAIPFEVDVNTDETGLPGQLPTLTALACPYPDLAEQDRMICALEKMLFSEMLGKRLRLTACRLDGDTCCRFEAHGVLIGKNTNKESLYDPAMD